MTPPLLALLVFAVVLLAVAARISFAVLRARSRSRAGEQRMRAAHSAPYRTFREIAAIFAGLSTAEGETWLAARLAKGTHAGAQAMGLSALAPRCRPLLELASAEARTPS